SHRARTVPRQSDCVVHLSVRGAAHDDRHARTRSTGLRRVHRASPSRARAVLPGSAPPMTAGSTLAAAVFTLCAQAALAQEPLQLAAVQQAAIDADPRLKELDLQRRQTNLRLGIIDAERKPTLDALASGQYQSDVPQPPTLTPGGQPFFLPPKGTIDASVRTDFRLFDATIDARKTVEQARLVEDQARVRTSLYALRQDVNDAFFAAVLADARREAVAAALADLEGRLREAETRVREGAAPPADAAAVGGALLQRRQDDAELRAARGAALSRLSKLTGRALDEGSTFQLPDLGAQVAAARGTGAGVRARPEFDQFARSLDRIAAQQTAASAGERPRFSTYARGGIGRPGLNFIGDEWQFYGLAGVQMQWRAWTWNAGAHEREALNLQKEIVEAEQSAFARGLDRAIDADLAALVRLEESLALDERIVTLRESIDRSAGIRFGENVLTASEYLDRSTELLQARSARAAHRVELAQARARVLTTLGLEVR